MPQLIISVSGLRGIVGENLTPQTALQYAQSFAWFLKTQKNIQKGAICVARDSRPSGKMLSCAVSAGLTGAGFDVIDLGIVATPSEGIMTTHLNCCAAVVITASHNPLPYNGIKLLLEDGMAPDIEKAALIKKAFLENKTTTDRKSVV